MEKNQNSGNKEEKFNSPDKKACYLQWKFSYNLPFSPRISSIFQSPPKSLNWGAIWREAFSQLQGKIFGEMGKKLEEIRGKQEGIECKSGSITKRK